MPSTNLRRVDSPTSDFTNKKLDVGQFAHSSKNSQLSVDIFALVECQNLLDQGSTPRGIAAALYAQNIPIESIKYALKQCVSSYRKMSGRAFDIKWHHQFNPLVQVDSSLEGYLW